MTLIQLGWNPYFTAHFNTLEDHNLIPARISRRNKYDLTLLSEHGIWTGLLPGVMKSDPNVLWPAVGDWVAVSPVSNEAKGVIRHVLPRKSQFSRKTVGEVTAEQVVAANIDVLFIVVGLDRDFNLRRIERYLTQVWDSGALPALVLNKADQCIDFEERVLEVQETSPGIDVYPVSALAGTGMDRIRRAVSQGITAAFVGSSGVGKSTLINRLMGFDHLETQAVRPDDQRGRHTTTFRELFVLPGGGVLIDTPGMRELQLWTEKESVDQTFSDIEKLAGNCRFRDCSHQDEPGCAVRSALENGALDPGRYRSFIKLQREIDFTERRMEESFNRTERARQREFSRMANRIMRNNPKR